jgi:WD40 repeat protein
VVAPAAIGVDPAGVIVRAAQIWDIASWTQKATLISHAGTVDTKVITADGAKATITGHAGMLSAVAIAPDGSWLATGSDDNDTLE